MSHRVAWRSVAALLVLSLAATACGRGDDEGSSDSGGDGGSSSSAFINPDQDCDNYQPTQGIEGNTIKVGTVRPAQGPYAIYDTVTKGLEAYFASVNAKGGVKAGDGQTYQIELLKEDDAYDPGRTPAAVKKLVEQDGIFAMVGEIGTENNLAVRQYMNENCVPSISLATGSPEWGKAAEFPWYQAGLPSYATEARRFLDYLEEEQPDATIALLYQADDFGRSYKAAIEKYIADTDTGITLVASQEYDPATGQTTEGVTTQLAQSGADVFFIGLGGTPCPRTLTFVPSTWQPLTYVSITCSGKTALSLAGGKDEGIYSTQALLDPGSPDDQANPKVQQFVTDGQAQGLSTQDLEGGIVSAGWGFGAFFVRGLELTDKVTRADLMNTMWQFDNENFGLLRDDIEGNTDNAEDPWQLEQLRVIRREGGKWVEAAPTVDYNGQSNSFAG